MQGFINQLISCKQTIQQMGVQYCSVKDCKSTSTCRDVHFFAFPKNILNSEWIAVVNETLLICVHSFMNVHNGTLYMNLQF